MREHVTHRVPGAVIFRASTHVDPVALMHAAEGLRPLAPTAARLVELANRPEWKMAELVDAVSYDAPLAGRVTALANSAAFAPEEPILTVGDAVHRIGFGNVLALSIGSLLRRRARRTLPAYEISEVDLWRHSVACSLVPSQLEHVCGRTSTTAATVAALLHDIGKVVLGRFLEDEE